jgi:hypothetical protein
VDDESPGFAESVASLPFEVLREHLEPTLDVLLGYARLSIADRMVSDSVAGDVTMRWRTEYHWTTRQREERG